MSRTKSAVARNAVNDAAVAAERPVLDRQEWFQIYRACPLGRDRARGRDLAVVAFLTQIQKLDAKAYRDLALGNVHLSQTSGAELATLESVPRASSACARCHGDEGQWPLSNVVPILHGQPAVYLLASLKAYAEGKRRSGIMQPLAADLAPEDMRELADYYAGLPHPQMPSTSETWRWWSGGGNWSSKVCQARTYRLARHATAMSGPEPRGPRSTTTARWRR
jgi:cytochrome c553